ncbi:DUF3868 domain-containing protein [Dysgonomonas sp. HDW5A]|uniref:DUF3868 domain-containing protein n=1 Tax=Dysgonomonas sp. HDW5A TaxID=2714926 RepID=UPI002103571F|nr:DUF3868 domain-containing protein [Dysgonomonas sp. HDW5A]
MAKVNNMKRLPIFILFILITLGASAKGYTGQITFVSNEVKEVNDSLQIYFKVNIRAGAVNDCSAMYITPQLLSGESVIEFPYLLVSGNKRYNLMERWESLNKHSSQPNAPYATIIAKENTDTLLSYNFKLPYEMWMDSARFVIKQEITGCRNENHLFTFLMNNKVGLKPHTPYQVNTLVAYIEPKAEPKIRKIQGQAYLDFQVGQSVIRSDYRRNPEELAKINELVKDVINDPDIKIKSLFIEGYASPEGSYATNDRLSYARAIALKNYMKSKFGLSESLFRVSNVAEDWDGLKVLIPNSNVTHQDEIIEIIDNTDIFEGRELKLMKLANGVPYRSMLNELFPQLRRVEYQINFMVKDYTLSEAKNLLGKKESQLSQLELFQIAQSFGESNNEFVEILGEIIPKYYPDDQTANNNAAAVQIKNKEFSLAKRTLSEAGTNPSTLNNMAIILLQEGNLDNAEKLFKKALEGGSIEAHHNLRELKLKREDNVKLERYKSK